MAKIGQINSLKVVKEVPFGVYLDGGPEGEILLPGKFVPSGCRLGAELDVFVYFDSEDEIIATTQRPRAIVGQFHFSFMAKHGACQVPHPTLTPYFSSVSAVLPGPPFKPGSLREKFAPVDQIYGLNARRVSERHRSRAEAATPLRPFPQSRSGNTRSSGAGPRPV